MEGQGVLGEPLRHMDRARYVRESACVMMSRFIIETVRLMVVVEGQ